MLLLNTDLEEVLFKIFQMNLEADETVLILVGEQAEIDISILVERLNKRGISFFGAIFPAIIYQGQSSKQGIVITKLSLLGEPILVSQLEQKFELEVKEELINSSNQSYSALILVDGLANNIDRFLANIFNQLANELDYLGGGAGSLSLNQKPCLFNQQGFFQNAALIAILKGKVKIGVRHGWKRMMGPFIATKTKANKIIELNWTQALEVYKQAVSEDLGVEIKATNFFEIAKHYPFGIIKESGEYIVRDPILISKQGEIICVGEVPENTALDILKGEKENLIKAAKEAVADCKGAAEGNIIHSFIIDCVSRTLFLGEDFDRELKEIEQEIIKLNQEVTSIGMITLGEISSQGNSFLEFLNKTIVVAMLCD